MLQYIFNRINFLYVWMHIIFTNYEIMLMITIIELMRDVVQ